MIWGSYATNRVATSGWQKGFENLPARMLHDLLKRVMLTYPLAWNRLFKRLHFGPQAAARYRYAPRQGERRHAPPAKGSYTAKKLRLYRHTNPLQFTGKGRAEAESRDFATSGRTHAGHLWARATLPAVFNLRNPKGRTDPPREITIVLASEQATLDQIVQEKLAAEFRRHSGHRG
jgi:hypothetical protein